MPAEITILTGAVRVWQIHPALSGSGASTLTAPGFCAPAAFSVEGQYVRTVSTRHRSVAVLVGMMFQNPELQFCMDTVEQRAFASVWKISARPGKQMDRREWIGALDFL